MKNVKDYRRRILFLHSALSFPGEAVGGRALGYQLRGIIFSSAAGTNLDGLHFFFPIFLQKRDPPLESKKGRPTLGKLTKGSAQGQGVTDSWCYFGEVTFSLMHPYFQICSTIHLYFTRLTDQWGVISGEPACSVTISCPVGSSWDQGGTGDCLNPNKCLLVREWWVSRRASWRRHM